jgi:hypothetical protein
MDNKHTNGAEQASLPGESFSEERRAVALEATWELEALNDAIRDLCKDLGRTPMASEELFPIRLKIRGMTARMADLIGVTMSVLDDDDKLESLARRVHGRDYRAADAEA